MVNIPLATIDTIDTTSGKYPIRDTIDTILCFSLMKSFIPQGRLANPSTPIATWILAQLSWKGPPKKNFGVDICQEMKYLCVFTVESLESLESLEHVYNMCSISVPHSPASSNL